MATVEPGTPAINHDAAPRKRRRRAPTTGAADDCFACRKRQSPCDRKRPYCSQCLKIGKECSGYKTTLTWGVGVASRGKLRGMSVPVANAPSNCTGQASGSKARGSSMSILSKSAPENMMRDQYSPKRHRTPSSTSSNDGSYGPGLLESIPERGYPYFAAPTSNPEWQFPNVIPRSTPRNLDTRELDPLQTTFEQSHDESLLSSSTGSLLSTASLGAFSESSCEANHDFPNTPEDVTFNDPFQTPQNALTRIDSAPYLPFGQISLQQDANFDSIIQSPSAYDTPQYFSGKSFPQQSLATSNSEAVNYHNAPLFSSAEIPAQIQPNGDSVQSENTQRDQHQFLVAMSSTTTHPLQPDPLVVTPRTQYLIDYYDKGIAPFLVAFEGPENPYRKHILPLAMRNAGLQSAIAALAANNIRMRQVPATLLSDLSSGGSIEDIFGKVATRIGRPTQEEQHYKAMSIEHLNSQLTNPTLAKDDAVLATLLVLCLFHVCDSGFSKFKTQLVGVQKLLKLRGKNCNSEFVSWVEKFFAWFDVLTACVNDREPEVHGTSIDLPDLSNNLVSMEEFSGCDGSLFKLIARLGRLNLLSQGRKVREKQKTNHSTYFQNLMPAFKPIKRDYYSMESDSDADSANGDATTTSSPAERPSFWGEWSDLRLRLQEWQPTRVQLSQVEPNSVAASELALMHLSEAFRYSALLYTERLACPTVPSAISNIQDLVEQAMYHIEQIGTGSCVTKFLLWPLFVTGTECVSQSQRELIRARCLEIQQKSGFYNNINALEVLEKVWRDQRDGEETAEDARMVTSQPFRWRNAMDRVDGEYIII